MGKSPGRAWHDVPEAGTLLGIRFFILWLQVWGRRVTRYWLAFVTLYFVALNGNARRSSRKYLQRLGLPARLKHVFFHLWHFATTIMDRLYFVRDKFDEFEIELDGHEHLEALIAQGRGAILLGGHLGSFEVMRCQSTKYDIPINVIGDFANADRVNAVLRQLNPKLDTRLISISEGGTTVALKVQQAIERGELVGILGDRSREDTDTVDVEFMGGTVSLPTGPYLLAAVLKCPIYFVAGLYHAPNRYTLHCEPFAERVDLPRGKRKQAVQGYVQRYAHQLEKYCRLGPYNWFNFFDFWPNVEALPEAEARPQAEALATRQVAALGPHSGEQA